MSSPVAAEGLSQILPAGAPAPSWLAGSQKPAMPTVELMTNRLMVMPADFEFELEQIIVKVFELKNVVDEIQGPGPPRSRGG